MKYILVMFPYPSGEGLHIGHWYNYSIMDSYCRWLNYNGEATFQPFGYDAFGLPAENYARKVGGDPREITYQNIANFRKEMERMNTNYQDILITSDPSYYRWTQWIFTKLHEKGLAYKAEGPVNFCPNCNTVLANEQVKDKKCERCETRIEEKVLNQWYFAITKYRDRLIKNLDWLDFPEGTKAQQREWLNKLHDWCISRQRKWGCPIPIEGEEDTLDTFVDSSFYYLRYLMNQESDNFLDSNSYKQVDLYIGGQEHACMHLIYARFINMFLYDMGVVPCEEPFKKLIHQGMITYQGHKMAKSKGNVVDPKKYHPDVLRLYLMFLGPYRDGGDWNDQSMTGIVKFLKRMQVWLLKATEQGESISIEPLVANLNRYMDADTMKVNKVVSDFMVLYNTHKGKVIDIASQKRIIDLLKVFAPNFSLVEGY